MPNSAVTNVERAYEYLRRKTIEFDVKPGERLNEGEIARHLNMSRAPVREAMNRLVSEGLLTVVPNQGFSCRRLSASEILALYEVRGDLETAALAQVDPATLPSAIAVLDDLSRSIRDGFETASLESLVDLDEEFHLRIAGLAGNDARVGILKHINARIRFVRRINLGDPTRGRSLEEHLEIVEALRAGDVPSACALLRRHLTLSAEEAAAVVSRGLARIYATAVT
ncbi:MAG: GntR family transcriptional regulator [Holophaga sp.]|jgi:DNA-binding GntR family transcriptional regulator